MRKTIPADLVLSIGDMPMIQDDVAIEIERRQGQWHLLAVHTVSLTYDQIKIEADGICQASGQWLQSPLSKAYWTAAEAFLATKKKARDGFGRSRTSVSA